MLRRLLELVLNIKPAPWSDGGTMRLEWQSLPHHDWALLVLAAVVAAAAGVVYLYRREGRTLRASVRLGLAGLRIVALLGVLAMLFEPALVFTKNEQMPSRLLVLRDESASMDLRDAYANDTIGRSVAAALHMASADVVRETPRRALAERALKQTLLTSLAADGDRVVDERSFAAQLLPAEGPARGAASGPATAPVTMAVDAAPAIDRSASGLGTAIRQALAEYRGQPLAGVLIVSDGQSNTGDPLSKAAEAAAAEGVPIAALAVGTPEGPRNARITKLDVSPVVFVRDPTTATVLVESRGLAGQPATVVLERQADGGAGAGAWEEIGRKSIVLEESGTVQNVPFELREERPTKMTLRARIEDVGPELTTADNTQLAEVRVIRQKIKVLFIAGHPFPEYEFIRNSLLRDTSLSAAIWLESADKDYVQPGTPGIKRLPETRDELDEFDCVILYDPNPEQWPGAFPQLLTDFVAKDGGGLIYIAGERFTKDFFDRPDDVNSAWLPLLPVVSEPGLYRSDVTVRLSARSAWNLEITPEGHADPVLQFSDKPEENDRILASLPGMYWHFPVTRAKSGATVLARHADPRMSNEYGNHVLLATQLVGPGRTFFVGFDSTYRWRYVDEQTFDGFWARMVDRAGRAKQLGGRYPFTLTTDRASYRPGSQVTLTARFDNPSDRDAGLTELHAEVEAPDEAPAPLTLLSRKTDPTVFEATFPVTKSGPHLVRVWSGGQDTQQMVRAATLQVPVELPNLEFDQPTLNRAALDALTRPTGGGVFDLTQLDRVPAAFKVRRVTHTLEDHEPIFNAPLLFGFVLACVFAEWILRKRSRLV